MQPSRASLLCRYHYDPLDRLADRTAQGGGQCFYLKDRLTTQIQGTAHWSIIQHEDRLLALHQRQSGVSECSLLAIDQQRSILNLTSPAESSPFTYTPYGHRSLESGLLSLLGFNGEQPDPLTGHYLLGNGYRAFNPVLMRFNSPDNWSPFGDGGLNAYVYCGGEPLNRRDDTGHMWKFLTHPTQRFSRASNNGYSPLRRDSGSMTTLNSVAGAAGPAAPTRGSNESLLSLTPAKEIKKINDPLNRNEAKLKNVRDELINLRTQPENIVKKTVEQNLNTLDFIDPEVYESLVRDKINDRIIKLEKSEKHYEMKINAIKVKALKVRDPNKQ